MIKAESGRFYISTANSTYMMRVLEDVRFLEHVYYGPRLDRLEGVELLSESFDINIGTVPYVDEEHQHHFYDKMLFEYPTEGCGDGRESALSVDYGNGLCTLSLVFDSYRIYRGKDCSFPAHALYDESTETLEIKLKDKALPIYVTLNYTVYEREDVILRSALIHNKMDNTLKLKRAASLAMDFQHDDFSLISFDGAWARERNENERPLLPGITVIDSKLGTSSNEHSPLVFLKRANGAVYGFNLIYSGCHMEMVDVSPCGKTRIVSGINDYSFEWNLGPGETFSAPEAICTYSDDYEKASLSFHAFINRYIVRGKWQWKERPVLINSWEASYFDFTEESLLKLAETAASLGFELFVLDDGWFGDRRNDTKGLGDWTVSHEVFPNGLEAFSEKIHERGLKFGIWVEPEMVNPDSDLFRTHPEWAIMIPGRKPAISRHQLVLDMSRPDVREYLYTSLEKVFSAASVDYVKWDMNRTITDCFSSSSECRGNGELMHRYILGIYDLMGRLVKRFPSVLFESCASGGNRYDLGMLCFMPQTWTSDNTDLYHRLWIQEGTLRGFPQSTMGAHVSASPGHQSLRCSLIESRFDVAAFGTLGYELDLTKLSETDQKAVKGEIEFYKRYRKVFQYGDFRPLPSENDESIWWSVTLEGTTIAMEMVKRNMPNTGRCDRLRLPFLKKGRMYRIRNRRIIMPREFFGDHWQSWNREENEKMDIRVAGDIITTCGIALGPQFAGNGFFKETRPIGDNGTRMYVIEEI